MGGRPGHKRPEGVRKFVIDFQGGNFEGLGRDDGVELIVGASRGEVSNVYNHPVVGQNQRWRAFFDIKADGADPVDLRAYLRRNGDALTETWIYQFFP
jgi:glucans biosynthesis protein